MYVVFAVLVFCFIGTLRARQPDIDINRIRLVPKERYHQSTNFHSRRSIITDHSRRHDYDNHSSRLAELRPSMHILNNAPSITEAKTGKIYQPKEDPRLFYQSDAYVQEINRKNLNNQVSNIYLGRGVVRATDTNPIIGSLPYRIGENGINIGKEVCVKCPHDRTLIAKLGVDRAILQYPRIQTCSGRKAPRTVRFNRIYGPEFGTLLKEGSHMVVGVISYKGESFQTCKMQIHVLLQSCPVPKYLISHCEPANKTCSFACRDNKAELQGHKTLTCGNNMQWAGTLPVCNAHTWCSPPLIPEHGHLSCKGLKFSNRSRFNEGSSCRIKCPKGWHRSARNITVCRRGLWTYELSCQRNHSNLMKN